MLQELTLRRSAIAYVYPENPQLRREENLSFYDRVTASGVQVEGFTAQGAELVLKRSPGPGKSGLEVRVGSFPPGPKLRLLVGHLVGDDPVELSRETADLVWNAFQKVWGSKVSRPDLTEVTLEFAVAAPGGKAVDFLKDSVGKVSHSALAKIGRDIEGFGFRFTSGPTVHLDGPSPPVPGASVDVRIERLMEPSGAQLFIQAQAKWPALNLPTANLPAEVQKKVGESSSMGSRPSCFTRRSSTKRFELVLHPCCMTRQNRGKHGKTRPLPESA